MQDKIKQIKAELSSVIVGKEDVIEKLLIAIFAGGHVLLDDVPGVGKTTMATSVGRVLGLKYRRIQFTPDVLPSDVTGFSMYNKETGGFSYMPGAAIDTNILLGDEINRTSSKTQSALLEAMEEGHVTVDGAAHPLLKPFIVIATQNNVGTAGTQTLPFAQLDRFLMRLSIGYPNLAEQMSIIRDRQGGNPADSVSQIVTQADVLGMQAAAQAVTMSDEIIEYIARLAEHSRNDARIELGISPRGALFIARAAKAAAYVAGRDFVIPEDIGGVFCDVCAHRVIPAQQSIMARETPDSILRDILKTTKAPHSL